MFVGVSLSAACTLSAPFDAGEKCPGITSENVRYTENDRCKTGDCSNNNDAIEQGYCPPNYRCVLLPNTEPYCRPDCNTADGEILCGEKCIVPESDPEYCGASGSCDSTKFGDKDYIGENCIRKGDEFTKYECLNSQCIQKECQDNYHSEIINGQKECVEDSVKACGSATKKCEFDERCLRGVCTKECETNQVLCDGKCWETMNNPEHCGAIAHPEDGHCYNPNGDMNCGEGGVCINGECVKNNCTDAEFPNMCENSGERTCVNFKTDPDNCGNCRVSCETEAANKPHAKLVETGDVCENGKCQFTCMNENGIEYHNCGTVDNPECVNLLKDNANCGTCGHACTGETSSCVQGECQANQCPGNQCAITNCENNTSNCGRNCINCYQETNANEATCSDDGVCMAQICRPGFHLVIESGNKRCVQNTNHACGFPDTTEGLVDCTGLSNIKSGSCEESTGKCKVTCQSGYHPYDDGNGEICEADDTDNCGSHNRICKEISHGTVICNKDAECELKSCDPNYHKNEGENGCNPDTATECGSSRKNCNTTIYGWAEGTCTNGECTLLRCDDNHVKYGGICIWKCNTLCTDSSYGTFTYYCCNSAFGCDNEFGNHSSCKQFRTLVQCTNLNGGYQCTSQDNCTILANGGIGGGLIPIDPISPIEAPIAGPGSVVTTMDSCIKSNQVLPQY